MDLQYLLKEYRPIYPEGADWADTLAYIQSDPVEAETLRLLVEVLETKGKFREQVTISRAEVQTGESEDEFESFMAVTDGTHRVCAHMVASVKDVDVCIFDENESDENRERPDRWGTEDTSGWCLLTEIIFREPLTEDELDTVFSTLRSVPINDDLWLTSGVGSSKQTQFDIMWDNGEVEDAPIITNVVKRVLAREGLLANVASIVTEVENWD